MTKASSLQPLALTGALSALFLSSCALPPREAWQRIQEEGLGSYIAGGWREAPASPSTTITNEVAQPKSAPSSNRTAPMPVLVTTGPKKENPAPAPASGQDSLKLLSAQSVPSLPGFVRSPYTNPPRLVDVKGTTPGTTMICPYTQRPFLVPADFQNPIGTAIASVSPLKTQPTKEAQNNSKPQQPAVGIVTPQTPATLAFNNAPAPKTQPTVTPSSPSGTPASTTPPAVKPTEQEVPAGTLIPGRPGFVNSPFAAKHQLVDVTGLPAGMEVKCPYTGKLFRVPAQEMVSSKTENPTQILSSPAPEKK
jgi:hypothetical protein